MQSQVIRRIAEKDGLVLAIKAAETGAKAGIGAVILNPNDPKLIDGVQVAPLALWPDDRGYFLEVARLGDPAEEFTAGFGSTQLSATLSYPGTIKAIHYHCRQTDVWAPVRGMFQVFLYDLRVLSPTFGRLNTFYIGSLRPWKLRIPPGVAHGYKVIGEESALLIYMTDRFYDPADEGRIPFDDPGIHYDWDTQKK